MSCNSGLRIPARLCEHLGAKYMKTFLMVSTSANIAFGTVHKLAARAVLRKDAFRGFEWFRDGIPKVQNFGIQLKKRNNWNLKWKNV